MRKPEPWEFEPIEFSEDEQERVKMAEEQEPHKGLFNVGDKIVFLNRKQRREMKKRLVKKAKADDRRAAKEGGGKDADYNH